MMKDLHAGQKVLKNLNNNKACSLVKKWAKNMNRHFSKVNLNGQHTHRKTLNIISHEEKANAQKNKLRSRLTPVEWKLQKFFKKETSKKLKT